MTDAEEIAREHVTWALKQGQTPAQIILSVGERMPYCDVNRTDAEAAVIAAYNKLRSKKNGRKAAAVDEVLSRRLAVGPAPSHVLARRARTVGGHARSHA
jgi:hypothetical protein